MPGNCSTLPIWRWNTDVSNWSVLFRLVSPPNPPYRRASRDKHLLRHGIKKVLILNGHGGNRRPIYGTINQWMTYFNNQYGEVDVRFNSYWDVLSHEFVSSVQAAPGFPSHAREFETSFTMHVHPENVRTDAIPLS